MNSKQHKWEGEAAYITDKNEDLVYKEATITIFEGNFNSKNIQDINVTGAKGFSKEDAMTAINAHENEHDLNKKDILEIKNGKSTKPEEVAYIIEIRTATQIGLYRDPEGVKKRFN